MYGVSIALATACVTVELGINKLNCVEVYVTILNSPCFYPTITFLGFSQIMHSRTLLAK